MDYALVGSALFLLYGHPNLQLNRVAAGVAAWGVLFLLLPGVQKSRLQTIGWVPPLMAVAESNPSHTLRKPHQLNPQIMSLKRSQPSDLLCLKLVVQRSPRMDRMAVSRIPAGGEPSRELDP